MDAQIGMVRYETGDVIEDRFEVFGAAHGGVGQVYFVRDRVWETELAMKSLLYRRGADAAEQERRFLREALAWLNLGAHPHITSGYFAKRIGDALRFFMEYVPGGSLKKVLVEQGALPLPMVLDLAAQMADGLRYVHDKTDGRPHRDLKPDNCLFDSRTQTLKITDFGLLKGVDSGRGGGGPIGGDAELSVSFQYSLTGQGAAVGTPPYMPPEQWRDASEAGITADVYAFGVMLFEMATGRRPFVVDKKGCQRLAKAFPAFATQIDAAAQRGLFDTTGDSDLAQQRLRYLQLMHARLAPPDPREFVSDLPDALCQLIERCLTKEPHDRPADFEVVGKRLAPLV